MSGPDNSTDYTVMPLEFEMTFLIGFKRGLGSSLGPMPDIAFKYEKASMQMQQCEYIANPHFQPPKGEEEGDDFDDEDEDQGADEKEKDGQRKLKTMDMSSILCVFVKKINEEFENRFEGALYGKLQDYPNLSRANAWYSLNPPERPFMLLCHGI